jgi:AcrR family transcriptional regulator
MSQRGDETRELLIGAARRVVERAGARRATLDDVAAEARMSRSSVYYHFANKGEMFQALVEREIGRLQEIITAASDPAAPADQRLVASFSALAGEVQRLLTLFAVTRDVAGELVPMVTGRIDEFQTWHHGHIADVLRDGVRSGHFVIADVDGLASSLLSAFHGLLDPSVNPHTDDIVRDASRLLAVILRGISATPSPEAPC